MVCCSHFPDEETGPEPLAIPRKWWNLNDILIPHSPLSPSNNLFVNIPQYLLAHSEGRYIEVEI